MVKGLVCFLGLSLFALGNDLHQKVQNLTGKALYQDHQGLIEILFKDKTQFVTAGYPNALKIIKTLKANGLFKLIYPKAVTMQVTFEAHNTKALGLFIRSMQQSLKNIGYGFFTTKQAKYDSRIRWTIAFKTNVGIDPEFLNKELLKRGIYLIDIIRHDDTKWVYQLDAGGIKLADATVLAKGTNTTLKSIDEEIFIKPLNAADGFSRIRIDSNAKNSWYPYVVFYDDKMHALKLHKQDRLIKSFQASIPLNTTYVKIADRYTRNNIRHGFAIFID